MANRKNSRKITDEDVADYILKKVEKQAKKLKSEKISGYSDDSNPFNDCNLREGFVWRKKILRDVARSVSLESFSLKAEKKRRRDNMAEIEKGKKRREARAMEKAQREEEMGFLARERARAEFQEWEKKEKEFLFYQSKVRSKIRLHEGRVKPIDVLINQLDPPSGDVDMEIDEPYMVFKGLTVKELEELEDDLKLNLRLDKATTVHTQYWEALLVICDWELAEARKRDVLDGARRMGREELSSCFFVEERGIHSSVEADVMNLLEGKTHAELEAQQSRIESEMRSGEAKVVEFWESLLKRIGIFKAKALLKEIHGQVLRKYSKHLQRDSNGSDVRVVCKEPTPQEEIESADDQEEGSYSPELLHGDDNEAAVDPEIDKAILEKNRDTVLQKQMILIRSSLEDDDFEKKALKAMGAMNEGDAVFGSRDEIKVDSQVCWWHDKFRPRKPKYFNRVHTGYEWNKYNRTHYDHENPPPKTVQGYKFNIFYSDLVDKANCPSYSIEKDDHSEGTCIIKFHAGPPYEDIAFRIVNKEWECSRKKGFKCTFERGILHLYFNFKRHQYRR